MATAIDDGHTRGHGEPPFRGWGSLSRCHIDAASMQAGCSGILSAEPSHLQRWPCPRQPRSSGGQWRYPHKGTTLSCPCFQHSQGSRLRQLRMWSETSACPFLGLNAHCQPPLVLRALYLPFSKGTASRPGARSWSHSARASATRNRTSNQAALRVLLRVDIKCPTRGLPAVACRNRHQST